MKAHAYNPYITTHSKYFVPTLYQISNFTEI